ncbi:MAG TPA: TIGR03067 domain-containing protein [Gemmatales bacterium]|nr:TIGR03067 domain-containing protein [Gemmatales bacterium]
MLYFLAVAVGMMLPQTQADDNKLLQGKWKVITVLENGKSLNEQEIATQLVADGHFNVDGLVISFLPPGQFEPKKIPFVIDSKVDPKTIDLMGTSKIGPTGIYLLSGDSLMLLFPGVNEKTRPADFSNNVGSHRVLVVLQRVTATSNKAPVTPPVAATQTTNTSPSTVIVTQLPAVPNMTQDMKAKLVGTWGHQTDEAITYYTLNANGTFSSSVDWKSGIKNTFKSDQRASGVWSLNNGVIVVTITASTDSQLMNQVFSWRVTNLSDRNLIAVDNQGRVRYEWRVR